MNTPYVKLAILLSIITGLLVGSTKTQAQMQTTNQNIKKITVTGSAEMEVIPDEIYFTISLREYFKEKDKNKVEIAALEKQLQAAVSGAGIPKENFQIENISGNRWQWNQRKKPVDFLESRRYVLKLNNLAKVDDVLTKVDAKGIEYVNISRYEHSKIEQYRKELKLKALQAAKEKAGYLVEGLNEQLGGVLEITEMGGTDGFYQPYPVYNRAANEMMMKADAAGGEMAQEPEIDFRKIKLRYEMQAVFAIK
ncbi:SIMPL domain-containing protein [Rhodocytophaga aerolata]|uniref:SIMPL domain-containing protein n=1 Tax=Rhodocytophaga aerolata TaxID=455078 RepID=A0ABT8R0J7_9BACT|nr:SIMPL domain-containing protein [Rhodocytophaga aerolata]MDO1444924.1 SIMPL domain-containing protein [Rhodocytophaga aerolata]